MADSKSVRPFIQRPKIVLKSYEYSALISIKRYGPRNTATGRLEELGLVERVKVDRVAKRKELRTAQQQLGQSAMRGVKGEKLRTMAQLIMKLEAEGRPGRTDYRLTASGAKMVEHFSVCKPAGYFGS